MGWHGGVHCRACSWPGKSWAALGGGSVATTDVAASGHMDAAPSYGIATDIFSRDDSDTTCAMLVGARDNGLMCGCSCVCVVGASVRFFTTVNNSHSRLPSMEAMPPNESAQLQATSQTWTSIAW